jgi:hypothetical protein
MQSVTVATMGCKDIICLEYDDAVAMINDLSALDDLMQAKPLRVVGGGAK